MLCISYVTIRQRYFFVRSCRPTVCCTYQELNYGTWYDRQSKDDELPTTSALPYTGKEYYVVTYKCTRCCWENIDASYSLYFLNLFVYLYRLFLLHVFILHAYTWVYVCVIFFCPSSETSLLTALMKSSLIQVWSLGRTVYSSLPSAAEEYREPSGKCQGIVREFHIVWRVVTLYIILYVTRQVVIDYSTIFLSFSFFSISGFYFSFF